MTLYMVELVVADWRAAAAWYANVLGWPTTLVDEAGGFALLEHEGGRIALKQGDANPGAGCVFFAVADLDVELARLAASGVEPELLIKASAEGYRRSILRDPDGHRVGLFEWVQG